MNTPIQEDNSKNEKGRELADALNVLLHTIKREGIVLRSICHDDPIDGCGYLDGEIFLTPF